MKEKFIVTPKTERSVTMTIRIEKELNDELEGLALKSSRSRNELINMSLRYAMKNIEFIEDAGNNNKV
ncbi:MAG: CopG family transcriptional regulator [Lachnospiraceae bacterium]|nr:CopG family transcriptional regulator [Lachnospiraceae bacterium]